MTTGNHQADEAFGDFGGGFSVDGEERRVEVAFQVMHSVERLAEAEGHGAP